MEEDVQINTDKDQRYKMCENDLFSYEALLLLLLSRFSCVQLLRPQRWQPTRLPRPWDSPGKNTSGLPFPSPMHASEK